MSRPHQILLAVGALALAAALIVPFKGKHVSIESSGRILQSFWPTYHIDPARLQTAGDWITMRNLYASLVDQQARDVVRPDLAESWTRSQDGLNWTFKLRPNLKWSDGSPMTPGQIVESLKFTMNGTTHTQLGSFVESVAVNSAGDILFHLKNLPENFLTTLSFVDLAIVHPAARSASAFSWTTPTSGPYQFISGDDKVYTVQANAHHWGNGAGRFQKLSIERGQADADDIHTLLTGDYVACHMAAGVATAEDVNKLKTKYDVFSVNADFLVALTFSKSSPVIAKLGKKWRQGFLRRLYEQFWKDKTDDSRRAVGLRPENYKGALGRARFDEELAKLPSEAAPAKLRLLMQTRQANRAVSRQVHQAIALSGMDVQIETKEGVAFRKAHDDGDFDLVLQFVGASESDPDSAWRMYNRELFEPAATSSELLTAQSERTPAKREALYREFEVRALSNAAYVPLVQEHTYICVGRNAELDVDNATEWGLAFSHLKRK